MEYQEAISKGFELYDELENEICILTKIHNQYTDINYSDEVLTIKTDWKVKKVEAEVEIKRDEIIKKMTDEEMKPKEAICALLTEKVFLSAREFQN